MIIRPLFQEDREAQNAVVDHPLQSYEWGEFRKETGVKVERIGLFSGGVLKKAFQLTFHKIPQTNFYLAYMPKAYPPDGDQLVAIEQLGKKNNAIFIKLEPDVYRPVASQISFEKEEKLILDHNGRKGKALFTKYSFHLDLTQSEDELLKNLAPKTRYNMRLAYKKGVKVYEDTSKAGMDEYIKILQETTTRQGFYAHTPDYFMKMWNSLGSSGMMKIFKAVYENTTLVCWIMFEFNGKLYYPYGASRDLHRNVMASNLMMWRMIEYGKSRGLKTFDMWGALGPEPDEKHPWYGFHKFKQGYGGQLMEYLGTYDIVLNFPIYQIYNLADSLRWKILRAKKKLGL